MVLSELESRVPKMTKLRLVWTVDATGGGSIGRESIDIDWS